MEKRIMGLNFVPDEQFEKMFIGLQNLVNEKYESVFFLAASKNAISKMKYNDFEGSNRLNGWIIPKDKAVEFDILFSQNLDLFEWEPYKSFIWAWNDTHVHGGWLYSFKGAVFGETVIE